MPRPDPALQAGLRGEGIGTVIPVPNRATFRMVFLLGWFGVAFPAEESMPEPRLVPGHIPMVIENIYIMWMDSSFHNLLNTMTYRETFGY